MAPCGMLQIGLVGYVAFVVFFLPVKDLAARLGVVVTLLLTLVGGQRAAGGGGGGCMGPCSALRWVRAHGHLHVHWSCDLP